MKNEKEKEERGIRRKGERREQTKIRRRTRNTKKTEEETTDREGTNADTKKKR